MKEYVKPSLDFVELRVDERLAGTSPGYDPNNYCATPGAQANCRPRNE